MLLPSQVPCKVSMVNGWSVFTENAIIKGGSWLPELWQWSLNHLWNSVNWNYFIIQNSPNLWKNRNEWSHISLPVVSNKFVAGEKQRWATKDAEWVLYILRSSLSLWCYPSKFKNNVFKAGIAVNMSNQGMNYMANDRALASTAEHTDPGVQENSSLKVAG